MSMKTSIYSLTVLAIAMLLPACSHESDSPLVANSENEIIYTMKDLATRSGSAQSGEFPTGARIPVGGEKDGAGFFLEEDLLDLDSPATKGTPVYTENAGTLYGSFASWSELGDADFKYIDDNGPEYWHHSFGQDPWRDAATLHFYMHMPADMTSKGVNITKRENGSITFTFDGTKMKTAKEQEDIVFAYDELTKSDYKPGKELTFFHALTGVKFALGNENSTDPEGTRTFIQKVVFKGLKDKGTCIVTPGSNDATGPNGGYIDVPGNHTSATVSQWSGMTSSGTEYSQTYGEADIVDFAQGGSFENNGKYPDSFASAANEKNLNNKDAEMTFWFVPQEITDDVKLEVTFYIQNGAVNGEPITREIEFGKLLKERSNDNLVIWKAGQLRTYTLLPTNAGVEIKDEINEGVKENVVITNTGNVKEYVRVAFIGNWCDADGNIVQGYVNQSLPTAENPDDPMITPWSPDNETFGKFEGLPGSNWVKKGDYYYYTVAIGAGNDATDPLFTKYTLGTTPTVYMPTRDNITIREQIEVHLVMEIAVQAIEGEDMTFTEAWEKAGVTL